MMLKFMQAYLETGERCSVRCLQRIRRFSPICWPFSAQDSGRHRGL